ncbi:16S rRNA (guanine(966)-N(2))-methyltransferase RsmD [Rhodococcus sp. HNM0569]|uniref:16S rRNA (guanine(966)-N(2))-methyltransferase RsmD n=1 Tax=Rhodococcus sp. HNM0569 TaxID=2716340 RepID=UPI001469AB62|nr:16S rRNA (guanine(966)-N(2))-methyltransferase RsmD [Rhodococcus sp. HNM0569]NLU81558.1 16S rRNA (guanine(966)-N(2))-methyltransferase RsmD [Rhodococcus sp. HNM0569]
MTRIVAGRARGRRLEVPPSGTRPTSDRVREAMFSAIESRLDLDGAAVLDLYAGSGALGLEALSRGAAHVVLVESDARAAKTVSRNIAAVDLPGASVRTASVAAVTGGRADREYDLVLADPPYAVPADDIDRMLAALRDNGWVGDGTVVVVERSTRSPETEWPPGYEADRTKKYGETRVEFATCYGLAP